MKKEIILNKLYIVLLSFFSFLAFLALQVKLISATPLFLWIQQSNTLAILLLLLLCCSSAIFTHLLLHLLAKYQ